MHRLDLRLGQESPRGDAVALAWESMKPGSLSALLTNTCTDTTSRFFFLDFLSWPQKHDNSMHSEDVAHVVLLAAALALVLRVLMNTARPKHALA